MLAVEQGGAAWYDYGAVEQGGAAWYDYGAVGKLIELCRAHKLCTAAILIVIGCRSLCCKKLCLSEP